VKFILESGVAFDDGRVIYRNEGLTFVHNLQETGAIAIIESMAVVSSIIRVDGSLCAQQSPV